MGIDVQVRHGLKAGKTRDIRMVPNDTTDGR